MNNFVISTLGDDDRECILDHLKRLSVSDRYMRFFAAVSDTVLEKYVNEFLNFKNQKSFGIYRQNRKLVAFAHLGEVENKDGCKIAELGISVDEDYRNLGIAKQLLQRVIIHCKANSISTLFMSCLRQNASMQKIAKKAGLKVILDHDEAIAELNLVNSQFAKQSAIAQDLVHEQISIFDKCYRYNSQLIDLLLGESKNAKRNL